MRLKRGEWPTSIFEVPDNAQTIHRIAVGLGILYEERQHLKHFSRLAYEINMLNPQEPRRRYRPSESDFPLWTEWHRVRGNDPYAYKARGYRLPQPIRMTVLERDGLVCGLCGSDVDLGDVHIDHIHPRYLGGTDDLDNLQVAHSFCNISKGARVATAR